MSVRQVTSYTLEFKQSSAKLAAESEQPISTTARELGVHEATLHGWVKRYACGHKKFNLAATATSEELKRVKKESEYPVGLMCDVLSISRSSYYDWLRSEPSPRSLENQRLAIMITEIFMENRCSYGTRRIRKVLLNRGVLISRRRVRNLMGLPDFVL